MAKKTRAAKAPDMEAITLAVFWQKIVSFFVNISEVWGSVTVAVCAARAPMPSLSFLCLILSHMDKLYLRQIWTYKYDNELTHFHEAKYGGN